MDGATMAMLEEAATDSVVTCPCGYGPLEPDYENCPECGDANPLRAGGLI